MKKKRYKVMETWKHTDNNGRELTHRDVSRHFVSKGHRFEFRQAIFDTLERAEQFIADRQKTIKEYAVAPREFEIEVV